MNISVIGIGRLGLCWALSLESSGHNVVGCDLREDYVKSLCDKEFKTVEPEVEDRLKKSTCFKPTTSLKETVDHSNILFVTVRTQSLPNGEYDHSQVNNLLDNLLELPKCNSVKHLIISCNVNPGFSNKIQEKMKDYNYLVSYNPEWIAQGSIIRDQLYPDVVVIGEANKEAGDMIENIHRSVCLSSPSFHRMDRLSAELTKVSLNCYLTARISLANMIGEVAIKSGVDPSKILKAIGDDSRIGPKYIKYGFGYGGPCFPRDTKAFIHYANSVGISPIMIEATDKTNKNHLKFCVEEFIKNNDIKNMVEFNSITYKPGVTIIEESQQLLLAVEIAKKGYEVVIREHIDTIQQVKKKYGSLFIYIEREDENK
jgi:UDPglucose 6-dehydrogenase